MTIEPPPQQLERACEDRGAQNKNFGTVRKFDRAGHHAASRRQKTATRRSGMPSPRRVGVYTPFSIWLDDQVPAR
jgi:hypothetical protein